MNARIDRNFLRIPAGQVHYRSAGADRRDRTPLYMAHAGPGCSRGLAPLIAHLGQGRFVVAPDMMGNGDSDPPAAAQPTLADYVADAIAVLDALGLDQVDVYGDHTGAHIGCELALTHPHRVRRLVLDGIPVFEPAMKPELLTRYAPAVSPDPFGGHLMWAWSFVRELFLHFPHYHTDPAHRLNSSPVPPPAALHALVVDVLKALPTYHLAYHAAFTHDVPARLPLVTHPTLLVSVDTDPLVGYLDAAAALLPAAGTARIDRADRPATVAAFLDA